MQLPGRQSTAIAVSLPKVVVPVLQPVAAIELAGQAHIQSLSFRPSAAETTLTVGNESPEGTVQIEQEELTARIRGCNLAFRALEAELDEKGTWTAARLEPLVDRLEILMLRRHDLELFRGVVPKEQRSAVEPLASAKSVVSPVAAHIVEARTRASGSGFTGTEAERQREWGDWQSFPAGWRHWRGSSGQWTVRSCCPSDAQAVGDSERATGIVRLTTISGSISSALPAKSSTWAKRPVLLIQRKSGWVTVNSRPSARCMVKGWKGCARWASRICSALIGYLRPLNPTALGMLPSSQRGPFRRRASFLDSVFWGN